MQKQAIEQQLLWLLSMAGRGTDIKLAQGVHEIGGLAVIINEHMENSRVDRQLRGRAGRQGDLVYLKYLYH